MLKHKALALEHCSMFKGTRPSKPPGRKSRALLGIVWRRACLLASLRLLHTHVHTELGQSGIAANNRRRGLWFPWQPVAAIFPRWQRNRLHGLQGVVVCELLQPGGPTGALSCPVKSRDVQTLPGLIPYLTLPSSQGRHPPSCTPPPPTQQKIALLFFHRTP